MGSTGENSATSVDIAVVGLACRFPGGASSPSKFWDLLYERQSAYTKVPRDRYNSDAFHHAGGKLGSLATTGGHFLNDDVTAFDAPFFSITSSEAKALDPTARLLLEVTYEALENAGLPMEGLAGSDTSCYVGCFTRDFHEMHMRDAEAAPMYAGTGTGFSLLSNRISWFYDLRGPSLTLDTACSSSLVGLHLACQGLRSGESKIAVVSGANLILSPDLAMWLSNLNMLAKDGLSRSFADGTTGYGRGEGIATLILKPLDDALRDGDCVRAVIRGTGVNQDGHTKGITVPSSDAQSDLIRSTYLAAGLEYSATHILKLTSGTGTAVGDPLELAAVARTLGLATSRDKKLLVGSVKSNIGHLEGAAGLAGVIKCILMLEKGIILPNIHFDKPNRRIPFDDWKIRVPTSVMPWPTDCIRRASVNSFGYGGTNAHAIIDGSGEVRGSKKDSVTAMNGDMPEKRQRLLVFSVRAEAAMDQLKETFAKHLELIPATSPFNASFDKSDYLDRLVFTLSTRRSSFEWKAYMVASTIEEMQEKLASSKLQPIRATGKPRITFIFTGQGAQWAGMGMQLMQYPVFRNSVLGAENYLKCELACDWSVVEELGRDEFATNIQLAKISQPVCTILQVALVDLLTSWNIKAAGVVGHSSGEIGAAYTYGAISREDAWTISYYRGRLCSELRHEAPDLKGSMMAVGCTKEDAKRYVAGVTKGQLVVACVNSPESMTISGDEAAVEELLTTLKTHSVFARKLKVENAYHSHHMKLIAQRYLDAISGIRPKVPQTTDTVVMASSVTGGMVTSSDLGPDYWVKNLVSPVLFSDAVQALFKHNTQRKRRARAAEHGSDFLLEIGPHAALQGPVRQILKTENVKNFTYKSILLRGKEATETAVDAAGALYSHGTPVSIADVSCVHEKYEPLTDLPSYPWNHSLKYWSESRMSKNYRLREHGRHDLLGSPVMGFDPKQPQWRNFLRTSENPWMRDHVVHSSILYPGSGIVAMPIEAVRQLTDKNRTIESIHLRDVKIIKAIVVPEDQLGTESFLQMHRQQDGWWNFSVATATEGQELEQNGSGLITVHYKSDYADTWSASKNFTSEALTQQYYAAVDGCKVPIQTADFYNATEKAGLKYGPSFQGLSNISVGKDRCCYTLDVPDTQRLMPGHVESAHLIHPTTLDIMFHSLFAALGDTGMAFETAAVPVSIESLIISADLPTGAGSSFRGFSQARKGQPREIIADICLLDTAWNEPKVRVKGIRCRELPSGDPTGSASNRKAPCGTLSWKPDIDLCDTENLRKYLRSDSMIQRGATRAIVHDLKAGCDEFLESQSATLESGICKALDLMAHKNPELAILQIGGSGTKLTAALLSVLAPTPQTPSRFSSLVVADSNTSHMEQFDEQFESWKPRVSFNLLRMDLDVKEQGLEDGSIDLIIIAADLAIYAKSGGYLQVLQGLLSAQGKLMILESTQNAPTVLWADTFMKANREPESADDSMKISFEGGETLTIYENPIANEDSKEFDQIHILLPPKASVRVVEVSEGIERQLSSIGQSACIVQWPPSSTDDLKTKPLLSLLEIEESFLTDITSENFELLRSVVLQSSNLLWVSTGEDPSMGTAVGYLRTLKNENPNLQLRFLWAENKLHRTLEELAGVVVRAAVSPSMDREFLEVDGYLCICRWSPDLGMSRMFLSADAVEQREYMPLSKSRKTLELVTGNIEQPESFYFELKGNQAAKLGLEEIEIDVKAMSISSDDLLSSTGQSVHPISKDFSGIVRAIGANITDLKVGDRVFVCDTGVGGPVCRTSRNLCQQIPVDKTFEEAASWPTVFCTAYYSLFGIQKLQGRQTILIQAATSGVGQAAIQLAKICGADVFATVSSQSESRIVEGYGVAQDHILNDADQQLAETISTVTGGKGIDCILNTSNSDDKLRQLWLSLAPNGNLISVNRNGSSNKCAMDPLPFENGCSFTIVSLDSILRDTPSAAADMLKTLKQYMTESLLQTITPLTLFSADTVVDAYTFAQHNGNAGQVLLTYSPENVVPISPSARNPLSLRPDATYVLAGGLGGLGRSLARLLVANGARYIVLLSRSGPKSPNAQALVQELAASGVVTEVYACDIADETAMKQAVSLCAATMPPIRGVIQSAAVIDDAIYDNMSHDCWTGVIRPKVHGSWMLHTLLPVEMDFFIMLASVSGIVGNRSQAHYAAGNTYQDALARYRRAQGLPAVSVDLGLMLGIGLIAERGGFTNLRKSEAVGLEESELHSIVKAAMSGSYGESVTPAQLITGLPTGGMLKRDDLDPPFYYDDPRFLLMKKMDLDGDSAGHDAGSDSIKLLEMSLAQCTSLPEAARLISTALCGVLAKGLQTEADNIDPGKPLHTYGVDSLMAVEIRTWILQVLKADISLFEVLGGGSIALLAAKIASSSKLVPVGLDTATRRGSLELFSLRKASVGA